MHSLVGVFFCRGLELVSPAASPEEVCAEARVLLSLALPASLTTVCRIAIFATGVPTLCMCPRLSLLPRAPLPRRTAVLEHGVCVLARTCVCVCMCVYVCVCVCARMSARAALGIRWGASVGGCQGQGHVSAAQLSVAGAVAAPRLKR